MISLSEFDSPLGKLSIAERRGKILALGFGGIKTLIREHASLAEGQICESQNSAGARLVQAFLGGKESHPRFPLDLALVKSDFDRRVLQKLVSVRPGATTSYGVLAEKAGHPGAARAVGGAMSRNPLPIVVPCHRVLPLSGKLGNYTGGVSKKRWLLAHEGVKTL